MQIFRFSSTPTPFSHICNHFSVIAEPIKQLGTHSVEMKMEITKSPVKPHELCIPAFCTCRWTCKMQTSFLSRTPNIFGGALRAITFFGEVNTPPKEAVTFWEWGWWRRCESPKFVMRKSYKLGFRVLAKVIEAEIPNWHLQLGDDDEKEIIRIRSIVRWRRSERWKLASPRRSRAFLGAWNWRHT